jgi:hypothetical protein
VLDDLAVGDAHDVHDGEPDVPAGRGDAEQLAGVPPGEDLVRHHELVVGQLVQHLYRETHAHRHVPTR